MQNGFVESFNGRLRDECLNEHLFTNLKEARQIIEEWRIIQHQPTALEPQRAHTNRVRSTPTSGAQPEQTLPINEDNSGSRSASKVRIMSATEETSISPAQVENAK